MQLTRDVRIGRCLKGAQSIPNDENASAETTEAAMYDGRDGKQCTHSVQA